MTASECFADDDSNVSDSCCAYPHTRRQASIAWLAPAVFGTWFVTMGPVTFLQKDLDQSYAMLAFTWAFGLKGAMSFLMTPALGGYSDHYGRRPFILLQVLVQAVFPLPLILMTDIHWGAVVALALNVVFGLAGSPLGVTFAYCADLAPPGSPSKVQTLTSRMLATGFTPSFILGPLVWKFLFERLDGRCVGLCAQV